MGGKISVCMVSLDCWRVLEPCLDSLRTSSTAADHEVIIVDNASTDETVEQVRCRYPEVRLILNDRNVGFTRATNQCIEESSGEYILWLNTDTLLEPTSLMSLRAFLEFNAHAGIVGPKVLNPDGSFQPQCRRGWPTPGAMLAYMSGFARLWPKSPRFGQYLLTYLPVDEPAQVASVSGCCLMARRAVWESIGPLDDDIFGFGEDLDWCVRASEAGWQVWYWPASRIVHLKGQGGVHAKPYHKAYGIHQAMWVFYRKHLKPSRWITTTAAVFLGVCASFLLSVTSIAVSRGILGRRA